LRLFSEASAQEGCFPACVTQSGRVYLPVILISFRNWSAVNQAFEHFSQAPVFEKR
jgi:hypothetical protein